MRYLHHNNFSFQKHRLAIMYFTHYLHSNLFRYLNLMVINMKEKYWEYSNNFKFLPSLKEFLILKKTKDFKFIYDFKTNLFSTNSKNFQCYETSPLESIFTSNLFHLTNY